MAEFGNRVWRRLREGTVTTEDEIFLAPPDGFAFEPVHPGEVLQEEAQLRSAS